MLNRKLMVLTIVLVSLLAISAVSANELNATDEVVSEGIVIDDDLKINDCDEEIIQANGGTFTELQNIIDDASEGSTINLEKDYSFDESNDEDTEITIHKSLIIDGKNHKINGLQKNNAFKISAGEGTIDVTLKNISFINCKCEFESYYADCIVNGKIENCNFMDRYDGGAIDFEADDLTVVNSNFINCNETGSGGAIAIKLGICTVSNCNFINDTTNPKYIDTGYGSVGSYIQYQSRGGAIFCGEDAQLSVYNCKFLNNNAICSYCGGNGNDGYGGAIHIKSDNAVVKNCYFEGNYASLGGDAIYWEGNYGNLDSCTFNNTASVYGANDVYWVGENGIISNCKSTEGIYTLNVFENSTVVNGFEDIGLNHEKDDGKFSTLQNKIDNAKKGAIIFLENDYAFDGIDDNGISISKSLTIDGQGHVLDGLSQSRIIFVDGIYTITLKNIKFKNAVNSAIHIESGYQPAYNHPYFEIINCEFDNNTAYNGGAIYCEISYVVLENCTFNSNVADNRGGAIMFARSLTHKYCRVTNCTFNNNRASSGGAIYSEHEKFTVETSKFNNNKANSNGGAIVIQISYTSSGGEYLGGHNSKILGCEFNYNKATSYGGAVYVHADYCSLKSSLFNYNVAGSGDAVYWDEGYGYTHGTISDCKSVTAGEVADNIHIRAYYEEPKTDLNGFNITVKIPISIECNDVTKYLGGPENYTIILSEGVNVIANAEVKITVDGKTSIVKTDSNGQASLPINLPVGTYDVVSAYGDVSNSSKVTVKSTIAINDATGTYSNSKVTATFLNTDGNALSNSQVSFKVGDKTYAATTGSNGIATANVDLGVGNYTVTAINPVNNEQKTSKLSILKANSTIALMSSTSNGAVSLTATLAPAGATGNVVFNINGENKNAAISGGKAILTLKDLQAGNYTVTASYAGDNNLNPSKSNTVTFNVAEVYPILTANDLSKTYGTGNGLVVNLADSRANAIANAVVNVNINNRITPIKTDANGRATMAIGQAPGTYYAKITYPGAKEVTAKIVVKKAKVKMTAKAKTFKKSVKTKKYTITLKNNLNKVMKNTKVTIKVNKKTYTAKTNKKGVATFKLKKLTKKGKYTATITYKGNAYYNKLTKKVKITVK